MNREIKFRAWDKIEREMIDNLISWEKNGDISHDNHFNSDIPPFRGYMWNSENLEIMQYTGLKDKNGEEIYEGDIIKVLNNLSYVYYDNGGFRTNILLKSSLMYLADNKVKIEIIGNIYENPELLEKK